MGKPKGLRTARKLKKHRQEQRWCDKKGYKVGTEFEKKKNFKNMTSFCNKLSVQKKLSFC